MIAIDASSDAVHEVNLELSAADVHIGHQDGHSAVCCNRYLILIRITHPETPQSARRLKMAIRITGYSLLLTMMNQKAKKMPKKFGALTFLSSVLERRLKRHRTRTPLAYTD